MILGELMYFIDIKLIRYHTYNLCRVRYTTILIIYPAGGK